MSWGTEDKVPAYRCTICDINWARTGRWSTCSGCGDTCAAVMVDPDEVLTEAQSLAMAHTLRLERETQAQIDKMAGIEAEQQAVRIEEAAAACLRWDADNEWLKAEPAYLAAWAAGTA